jgi:hypothetical protein
LLKNEFLLFALEPMEQSFELLVSGSQLFTFEKFNFESRGL